MSSAAPPPLCLHCGKVPLTYDDLRSVIPSEGAIPFFLLGSWSHVSTSPCPLCQLVAHAIFEAHRLSPGSVPQGDDETFALVWKDDAVPGHRGAYSINDSTNTATGQFVCFVSDSPETTQVASSAHFLLPTVKSKVEISRILHWIETCTTTHPITRCRAHNYQGFKSTFPRLQVFRLVDLENDSLIEVSDIRPYKYVALSYVWGGVSSFRLTKSTLGRLQQPGSVSQIRDRLSLTILDTMKLVKLLGLRYVWVDLLCLVQDDSEDLRRGTAVMVYQTGGWTFQEQALCQRALCFVDNKVFFRCGSDEFSEACLDQPVGKKRHEWEEPWSPPQVFRLKHPVRDWEDIVSRYSARALTDQRDVLRAVEGIMRRATEKGNIRFIEGSPVQAIDFFLLFGAGFTSMTARRRREEFPSWSWSGWDGASRVRPSQGHVFYQRHHWLKQNCWILWYEKGVDGESRLFTDPVRNSPSGPRYRERFKSQLHVGSDAFRTAPSLSPTVTPGYSVLQFGTLAIFLEFSRSISWSEGDL
ncbi:tol protein [Colletotrichum asianum]